MMKLKVLKFFFLSCSLVLVSMVGNACDTGYTDLTKYKSLIGVSCDCGIVGEIDQKTGKAQVTCQPKQ